MIEHSLLRIYSIIWILFSPLLPFILLARVLFQKEVLNRLNERLGLPLRKRPKGKLIWINAVSVGEVRSILPLAKELTKKNIFILLTSVTTTSAKHVEKLVINKNFLHQFSPLDHPICANLFLKRWKPDLSIFVESEIWPNLIHYNSKRNIPIILVQARISEKTFKRWKYISSLAKFIFKKFDLIITQDYESKNKFIKLGGKNIIENINLKSLSQAPKADDKSEKELLISFNSRPLLLFASIHEGIEEVASIVSHLKASKIVKNLLTIIVPRHPLKITTLIKLAEKEKLNYEIRSQKRLPKSTTEIYIADTIGEIGTFFSNSDLCFIGGSLSNKGGHNLIEPALEKCSIIYGPDVANHKSISKTLIESEGAIQIQNEEELYKKICYLFIHKEERKQLAATAYRVAKNMPNPTIKVLKKIEPLLTRIKR